MKKLVEEIRKELLKDDCYEHMVDGLNRAIEIIQSHNSWTKVTDELPPPSRFREFFSINILTKDKKGIMRVGYYFTVSCTWWGNYDEKLEDVVEWSYLPEMKHENNI